ncbi:Vegetative incompatibility protein HET-E-1 [Cytospora mali]|uniref:Vegetative incompatibility protein HET-E-1 n=1 Tax=Cytospora mali TaxID=578113 RepID=A0A194V0E9_CYTMA|nr:Vegetative incompatibility protein HET-E-1 [Valsa mali var. pyri (nom. inval.)]
MESPGGERLPASSEELETDNAEHAESPMDRQLREALAKLDVHQKHIPGRDDHEHSTGELLYDLAMKTPEFERFVTWDGKDHCRILRVSGRPGAGKSMLLDAAVRRLPKVSDEEIGINKDVTYFLCNRTRWRQADALSAVKGLISGVLRCQPELRDHLRWALEEWGGYNSLEGFYALSTVLYRIIQVRRFVSTYFVVDGTEQFVTDGDPSLDHPVRVTDEEGLSQDPLDERGFGKLLHLISTAVELTDKVKWVLSVDHGKISAELTSVTEDLQQHLVLDARIPELHADITQVVHSYATHLVGNEMHYHNTKKEALTEKLRGAPSNFLWMNVALTFVREFTPP